MSEDAKNARLDSTQGCNNTLCAACQSFLVRPSIDPKDPYDPYEDYPHMYRPRATVSNSALNGCILCKFVLAATMTVWQNDEREKDMDGWKLALSWYSDAFYAIQVIPFIRQGDRLIEYHLIREAVRIRLKDSEVELSTSNFPSNTDSEFCKSIALRWLRDCLVNHTECHEERTPSHWLPTRLIDVGSSDEPLRAKLVLSSELEKSSQRNYTALSHRWAAADRILKLYTSNIDSFKQGIPLETLPKTFLDALKVTRDLEVRYVWIDSICILQNSPDDWMRESVQMGSVYQNSVCNLAAPGGSDYGGGLFQERDPAWVTECELRIIRSGHDKIYMASIGDSWGRWICRSSLNKRGWVLQERTLSPRTLHFSTQMFWECRCLLAYETFPKGSPYKERLYSELDGRSLQISAKNWPKEYNPDSIDVHWPRLLNSYVRCGITETKDRLIAFGGIAKLLQSVVEDVYLAGLWKSSLPYNLVWCLRFVEGAREPQKFSFKNYRCPSWSWAALNFSRADIQNIWVNPVSIGATFVTILEANVEPLGSDPFGALCGGHIRLAGRLGSVPQIHSIPTLLLPGLYIPEIGFGQVLENWELDDSALFCMPVFNNSFRKMTECILLQRLEPDRLEFFRVGVLRISSEMDPKELPDELRWIAKYDKTGVSDKEVVTIMIY